MIPVLLITVSLVGCGKKAPPLTPVVRIPAETGALTARRVGRDIYVSFAVPASNIDGSKPASVAEVAVYAATALTPPPRARFLEIATLVGRVPVAPAADPEDPGAVMPLPDPDAGIVQGDIATIRDTLTAEEMVPLALRQDDDDRAPVATTAAARAPVLRRFYMAVPFSDRRRSGPPSALAEVAIAFLPPPPTGLDVALTSTQATLRWEPAGGLLAWLAEQGIAQEARPLLLPPAPPRPPAPASAAESPPGPTTYNVYRDLAPDPLTLPERISAPAWDIAPPRPITTAPIAALTYADPIVVDERQRCYEVRALRGGIESDPSMRACVTPVDVYPPAAPTALSAFVSEGAINLIWDPGAEPDLGGYIVLRREVAGDTLLRLTDTPIAETRFSDRTAMPGVSYTYEVRAVDSRIPLPNVSPPAEVTETAR